MEKSADALRTISEVALELDVPKHVLRFWESKFSHINPMKRGGGRRYYRPSDIELLRGIQRLLYGEGYTIRGVQQILKREGVDFVKELARPEVKVAAVEKETLEKKSGRKKATDKKSGSLKVKELDSLKKDEPFTIDPAILANLLGEIEECRRILNEG